MRLSLFTMCVDTEQVEVWLNRLLDTMQSTIRHEMTEAVVSYEEKPRDQWLFEPPAQVGPTRVSYCHITWGHEQ